MGGSVGPLPPIAPRGDAAVVPVPPPSRPANGQRPGSGGRRAGSDGGVSGVSPTGDNPDVEALADEVRQLEAKLERAARRRGSASGRPRSGPKPQQPLSGTAEAHVSTGTSGLDFRKLLSQVRQESQATLKAMESAGAQKGSLEEQVADLTKKLHQVTAKELNIVEQLSTELKQNGELKKALSKCEEELAVQRALNDEELGMVDELAAMEEERDRLRVEVKKLRDAAAPLQETIVELEEDKTELSQLLTKSEERINVLSERLQGGAELFENKEKELQSFVSETAEKIRFLDKKIQGLEEDLGSTKSTLAQTQQTLEETSAELDLTKKTAAADAATAASKYADMSAQYEEVKSIIDTTKSTCEAEVKHARSDRTIIVKELRRLQEKEKETRSINDLREKETKEYRKRMEEAQDAMEEATKNEAIAQGKLEDALDEAQRERDRSAAMQAEIERVNDHMDGRHMALDKQHEAMNQRMEEMERTMAANLEEVRQREEEANKRVQEVDQRIEEVRVDLVQKTADCVRLDESLKALEEGSAKAWTELVEKHELEIQQEREAAVEKLARELESQEEQLNSMWQKRLDDEIALHQTTTENLALERASLAECRAANDSLQQELGLTQTQLTNVKTSLESTSARLEKVSTDFDTASSSLKSREEELLDARHRISTLEATLAQRDLEIAGQEEEKTKLRDEVSYMEEKLVAARTDKLDAVADMQVRNVLLEKELVVRNEQAGLNGEAKVRLQRDQERQRQRVAEMGRTIDFLRSDVRRLDEERIELRETYRKDMQRLTAERDAYMDEVDRMAFIMTERNATSEEVLSRAKGEGDGLDNKLDMARGLFDSILHKLENPEVQDSNVSVTQPSQGGLFGAAGSAGPGSVRVSVDMRAAQKPADEFNSDDDDDDEDEIAGAGSTMGATSSSVGGSAMLDSQIPKTEELLEGVTTDQWNRRKERRARRKRELESLRRQLRESEAERGVLTRALQDLTRNLAQLRFTGETTDSLAPPQFVVENGEAVKTKTQPGIGGVEAAGSRRASSRASTQAPSVTAPPSRADSRTSLSDAVAGAYSSGRAPPPTHFNYGPSLPPPSQQVDNQSADAVPTNSGAVGNVTTSIEASKDPPNLDEIFDYAAYLGLDTALDHELLWIAEEALCCPLPSGWTEHTDSDGNIYFHHAVDDVSTYEHPMDKEYKALAARAKADKSEEAISALRQEILDLKRQQFLAGATGGLVPAADGDATQDESFVSKADSDSVQEATGVSNEAEKWVDPVSTPDLQQEAPANGADAVDAVEPEPVSTLDSE